MRAIRRFFTTIDFRSDTVSLPTPEMRKAWETASFSLSQLNELELRVAKLLGKEASVWMPSGTMSNAVGVMAVCPRSTQLILGDKSHIFQYENGGISSIGGVMPHPVKTQADGRLLLEDISSAVKPDFVVFPRTSAVALENTQNVCSGRVLSIDYIRQVREYCDANNFKLYLDGSRLLNAYVAMKTHQPDLKITDITDHFHTVNLCLSKGLSCPIGSLLAADHETIVQARRYRDVLGGNIPQPGAVAICGLVALDQFEEVLSHDHEKAQHLASNLRKVGYTVYPFETNILDIQLASVDPASLVTHLRSNGILANARFDDPKVRLVTHSSLPMSQIDRALEVFGSLTSS